MLFAAESETVHRKVNTKESPPAFAGGGVV